MDALRTALAAIEWPEDELSVFATLRGPLFAIGEEELLEYHARSRDTSRGRAFDPYRVPQGLPDHLRADRRGAGSAARSCTPAATTGRSPTRSAG